MNLHTRIQRIGRVVQLQVALASREEGLKDAAVVGVNVIHRGGEHLRNVAADLVHDRVQVAAGRLQILNLLVQVGVAFGQRLVLLQRQRVNGAQCLQFGAGCFEASADALGGGFGSLGCRFGGGFGRGVFGCRILGGSVFGSLLSGHINRQLLGVLLLQLLQGQTGHQAGALSQRLHALLHARRLRLGACQQGQRRRVCRLQVLYLIVRAGQALLGVLQGGAQLVQLLLALAHLLGKNLAQALGAALNLCRGCLLPRARQVGILAGALRLVGGARLSYGFLRGGEALVQAGALILDVLRGSLQGLRLGAGAGMLGARHACRLRRLAFGFDRCFCRGLRLLNRLLGFVQFGAGAGHDLGCGTVGCGKFQGAGALSRVEQAVAGVLGARGVKNTPDSALTCGVVVGEQAQGSLCGGGIRREQHACQALAQRRGDARQGVLIDAGERGGILAERFNRLGCGADTQLA